MFGYVKPRVGDLLVREHDFYRAVYCGVCREMKKTTGRLSSVSLSYDVVFLALVRMLYTDRSVSCRRCRCVAHPCRARDMAEGNEALTFSARASALLSYHKLKDDIIDSSFFRRIPYYFALPVFSRARKKAKMGEIDQALGEKLAELRTMEKEKLASVDRPAHISGELLGMIFAYEKEGEDAEILYEIGYHLGCFVYAADAAEDYPDDCRTDSYNPYRYLYGSDGLSRENRENIHTALILRLSSLETAVNRLPFGDAAAVEQIIKNILYLGLVDRIGFLLKNEEDGANERTNNE